MADTPGFNAVIEMSKGDTRRRHFSSEDKTLLLDLGPVPKIMNDGIMPEAYGFLDGIINKAEGDEVDIVLFSNKEYLSSEKVVVFPIGIIIRSDKDHKVLAVDDSLQKSITDLKDIPDSRMKPVLRFFGAVYPIVDLKGKREALEYIDSCSR